MSKPHIENVVSELVGEEDYKKIKKEFNTMESKKAKQIFNNVQAKVYRRIKKEYKDFPKEFIKELLWFCTVSDNATEKELIASGKLNLCANCGWCCNNCEIYVNRGDIQKMHVLGVEPMPLTSRGNQKFFKKCKYLGKDNKCQIYHARPKSCSYYPLTLYGGHYVISKKTQCEFSLRLVEMKFKQYIEKYIKLEQEGKGF